MSASNDPVSIPRVEVFPNRLRILVRVGEGIARETTAPLIEKAVAAYPTLLLHSCINSKGPTFGDVAVDTSLPHLLEHLVIAEQVSLVNARLQAEAEGTPSGSAARAEEATFVGTTEWVEPTGPSGCAEAIVEVSFVDDLEAIAALKRALSFLNASL